MNPGTLALFIPILGMSIPIIAIWSRHQQRLAEIRGKQTPFDDSALRAQADKMKALEDRVKVLERIVTDGNRGTELASQIEALRDDAGVPLAFEKERV